MSDSFRQHALPSQPIDVGDRTADLPTSVGEATELEVLRQVIGEKGHTLDSLSAAMKGKDRSTIHKVISGDRPMPPGFTDALPDEVQAEWHARCTKRLRRHHVVPVLSQEEAREQYLAGHINLSMNGAPDLPDRTAGQLKVNLDVPRKAVAR